MRRKLVIAAALTLVAIGIGVFVGWQTTRDDSSAALTGGCRREIEPAYPPGTSPQNSGAAAMCIELPPLCEVYDYRPAPSGDRWIRYRATHAAADRLRADCRRRERQARVSD